MDPEIGGLPWIIRVGPTESREPLKAQNFLRVGAEENPQRENSRDPGGVAGRGG